MASVFRRLDVRAVRAGSPVAPSPGRAAVSSAPRVVGSLGMIGAAAAVAGLGTFGAFTDSTAPVPTTVTSSTVDLDLAQGAIAVPATTNGFVPGDSLSRALTLRNDGDSSLSSLSFGVTAASPSILTTDTTHGLQLALKACSVAWTQGGPTSAPTYTCAGTETVLVQGPAVGTRALPSPASLIPGGVDRLVFTISLPTTADNSSQARSSTLTLTFTGVQRDGTPR